DDGARLLVRREGRNDETFVGLPLGTLRGDLLALLAEDLDGLVEVAVGFGEGLFAVHHADPRHLAEPLYVCCGNCHGIYARIKGGCPPGLSAPGYARICEAAQASP